MRGNENRLIIMDVQILSASASISANLALEIPGIDTTYFEKTAWINLCKDYLPVHFFSWHLMMRGFFLFVLFLLVKKKISGTITGCYLSLPEQDHLVSVLKSPQNCSSASGSPWFSEGPYCEQKLNFGTWKSWSRVHQLSSSLLD